MSYLVGLRTTTVNELCSDCATAVDFVGTANRKETNRNTTIPYSVCVEHSTAEHSRSIINVVVGVVQTNKQALLLGRCS